MRISGKIKKYLGIKKAPSQRLEITEAQPFGFTPIEENRDHDIFIAGYPKSGNTWMQNLISGLLFGMNTTYLPDSLTQELVPDVHVKRYYKRFHNTVFFKTHDLPKPSMKRVIHLVRDGRDVMASYYAYNQSLGLEFSLEEMIKEGKGLYISKWHEHTRAWIDNPYSAEILRIKYEDLQNDPILELHKILTFSRLERPQEVIKATVLGNSFKEMKRKEKEFGWDDKIWKPRRNFIRQGKIGSYTNEIPAELINFFQHKSEAELNYFNYL